MGTAGRERERASGAPARLVEGRRGAALSRAGVAVGTRPANAAGKQAFRANRSAWPFANFTGGMGGRIQTLGGGNFGNKWQGFGIMPASGGHRTCVKDGPSAAFPEALGSFFITSSDQRTGFQ